MGVNYSVEIWGYHIIARWEGQVSPLYILLYILVLVYRGGLSVSADNLSSVRSSLCDVPGIFFFGLK